MTHAARSLTGAVAAALLLTGALAACSQTVEGTATRAGNPDSTAETRTPTTTRRPSTTSPRTTAPPRTTVGPTPGAPPPGDPLTMTCGDYADLDVADQQAVIDAILSSDGSVLGPESADIAKSLADAMCQFLPRATVNELLTGTPR